jgi:hypothetical protein
VNRNQLHGPKGNFKKLHQDIKRAEIHITGKCATFIKNEINGEGKKCRKLMESLASIQAKDIPEITNEKFTEFESMDLPANFKLDTLIAMGSVDCYVKNGKIYFLYGIDSIRSKYLNHTDSINEVLKTFRTQAGAISSKAASNDADGQKAKKRNKEILDIVNTAAFSISDVRGCPERFKGTDDVKDGHKEAKGAIIAAFKATLKKN